MYIRIEPTLLKFRISKGEAEHLILGEQLIQRSQIAPDQRLIYSVELTDLHNQFLFDKNELHFSLKINSQDLQQQLKDRPSKTGIIFSQENDDKSVKVSLEIDIKRPKR